MLSSSVRFATEDKTARDAERGAREHFDVKEARTGKKLIFSEGWEKKFGEENDRESITDIGY